MHAAIQWQLKGYNDIQNVYTKKEYLFIIVINSPKKANISSMHDILVLFIELAHNGIANYCLNIYLSNTLHSICYTIDWLSKHLSYLIV